MPPTDTDPTEDMVKAEIAAAVKILREDVGLKHSKTTAERLEKLEARFGGDNGTGNGDKTPPPKKDEPAQPPATTKRGLWWGDALNESQTA